MKMKSNLNSNCFLYLLLLYLAINPRTSEAQLNLPQVDDQCVSPGMSSVSVEWETITHGAPFVDEIRCTEGSNVIDLSGGTFSVGSHTVACTPFSFGSATGQPEDFSFNVLVCNPTTESMSTTTESTTELTPQPTTGSTPDLSTEATAESSTEATAESSTEATAESSTEATAESSTEATAESSTEPTAESSTEKTAESSTEATVESSTEATAESNSETTAKSNTESFVGSTSGSPTEPVTEGCSLICLNGGALGASSCQCSCTQYWTGPTCSSCSLTCLNGGTLDASNCICRCAQSWTGSTCSNCPLTAASCLKGGTFSSEHCECVCPAAYSGVTCNVADPCVNKCTATGQHCVPDPYELASNAGYRCPCRELDGYFYDSTQDSCTKTGFKAITITLIVVGVNGNEVFFRPEFSNSVSATTREFLVQVSNVIQHVLRQNPSTNDLELLNGDHLQSGSVVFIGVVKAQASSPITANAIMQVLQTEAAAGPLSDGQTTLNVDPAVTAIASTTACPFNYCRNGGTCYTTGQYPLFVYSCRCATGFTGSQCESVIPVQTAAPRPTTPPVTPDPEGGLSPFVIALIVVGVITVLLLVVFCVAMLMCLARRPYGPTIAEEHPKYRRDVYEDSMMDYDFLHGNRMDYLHAEPVGLSPYMQQSGSRHGFMRPYMVDGGEAHSYYRPSTYGEYQAPSPVYRNPVAHYETSF